MPDYGDFAAMVKVVADTPEQIRPCDIARLLESARVAFDTGKFYTFVAWLHFSGAKIAIHPAIDAWLAEEDASQIDMQEETFSLTFSDRPVFDSISKLLSQYPLVVDIGHSDMKIIFEGIES